jgi:hypothetical protein
MPFVHLRFHHLADEDDLCFGDGVADEVIRNARVLCESILCSVDHEIGDFNPLGSHVRPVVVLK